MPAHGRGEDETKRPLFPFPRHRIIGKDQRKERDHNAQYRREIKRGKHFHERAVLRPVKLKWQKRDFP